MDLDRDRALWDVLGGAFWVEVVEVVVVTSIDVVEVVVVVADVVVAVVVVVAAVVVMVVTSTEVGGDVVSTMGSS